eukprot:g26704.t1
MPAADAPSAELALSFRPVQKDVEYDTPKKSDYGKCTVKVERRGKQSGWVVFGPNGQTLRRFIDTNADNVVDEWRYYHNGLEVYRDVDGNFNNKVDQSRWLNTGGTRWGIDSNEDGRIDSWKMISAEEVSREAVRALATGDAAILSPLLVTQDELAALEVVPELRKKINDSVSTPAQKLKAVLTNNRSLTGESKWVRFNAALPSTIPADDNKAAGDLIVYENAMAIVETAGKSGLVQIGEMLQIGKTWKLTQIPRPLEDNVQIAAGGLLMQPSVASANTNTAPVAGALTPEMQKLLESLQTLDKNAPQPTDGANALARYNASRADIIMKIVAMSKTDEERDQWSKQLVDGLAASVQSGLYPAGLKRLKEIEADARRNRPKSSLVPYVTFRRLLAEYTVELQNSTSDKRASVQKWWLKELERFAAAYPESNDASEAMLQLAITQEFGGEIGIAKKWYRKLVADYAKTNAGIRASGAMRRLEIVGKPLQLAGPRFTGGTIDTSAYRGKVLLVLFWSTWCKPCTEDLPQLKALYAKYRAAGFEVLGVNLDVTAAPVKAYIAQHSVPWPHIFKPGGLESEPGKAFGIISLPTMFLVDRNGKVLSRSVSVELLKKQLPDLLKRSVR